MARKNTTTTVSPDKPLTAKQKQELRQRQAGARARAGNGSGGGGRKASAVKTVRTAPTAKMTIEEMLLKRLTGVGPKAANDALDIADVPGSAEAPRVMLNRANLATKEKGGLRGKALALWVLTGKSDGGEIARNRSATPAKPKKTKADEIPAGAFVDYLKAEVSGDHRAPVDFKPTIDETGKLRVKSTHFREWLSAQGYSAGAVTAARILRAAGLEQERWFVMKPGKRMMFVGSAPAGTGRLPRRKDEPIEGVSILPGERRGGRSGNPLRRLDDEQRAAVKACLKVGINGGGAVNKANKAIAAELLAKLEELDQQ
jgi:hypothetical protein